MPARAVTKKRKPDPAASDDVPNAAEDGDSAAAPSSTAPVAASSKKKAKGGLKADKIAGMLISQVEPADGKKRRREDDDSTTAIPSVAAAWGLDPRVVTALQRSGLKRFFPIQLDVVPAILAAERSACSAFGDVCVSAPTGSGKTIAYALPIVQVRRAVCASPFSCCVKCYGLVL